jgi:hypothetical protein
MINETVTALNIMPHIGTTGDMAEAGFGGSRENFIASVTYRF